MKGRAALRLVILCSVAGCGEASEPALEILGLRACAGDDLTHAVTLESAAIASSVVRYAVGGVVEADRTLLDVKWRFAPETLTALGADLSPLLPDSDGITRVSPGPSGTTEIEVPIPADLARRVEDRIAQGRTSLTLVIAAALESIGADGTFYVSPEVLHSITFCAGCEVPKCNASGSGH